MQTAIEIGSKIAVARKLKNLSQAELATQMAVTAQAVGKWERGESMPDILAFDRLTAVLGVELNYFSEGGTALSVGTVPAPDTEEQEEEPKRPEWNMSGGNWEGGDFSGLSGLSERLRGSNIQRCKFVGSGLARLTLRMNNVQDTDFSNSDLSNCRFSACNLERSIFNGCDFSGAELTSSNIQKCALDGADFTGAVFKRCNFEKSSVAGAKWLRTVFRHTNLEHMTLDGEITDCAFEGVKIAMFQNATLRNTFFKNCKLRKLKFENCRADSLTIAFLKSSGAKVEGVALLEDAV